MPQNNPSNSALDLYAHIEDIIGVQEIAPQLYAHYFLFLSGIEFDSLLDVGCGSGFFLSQIQGAFAPQRAVGIDLSSHMVESSKERGIEAYQVDLCYMERGSFDVLTAVFDMLNYLDAKELQRFLSCAEEKINEGGYLLFDINTLHGFEDIAVGSFITEEDGRFVAIDSEFDAGLYSSDFTLFERQADESYLKSQGTIQQYHHTVEDIQKLLPNMTIVTQSDVTLYSDRPDKEFVVFCKETLA